MKSLDHRLEEESSRDRRSEHPDGAAKRSWGALLRGLLAVHVARSAERVLDRRSDRVEAGRRGGAVTATATALPGPSLASVQPPAAVGGVGLRRVWEIARLTFAEFGRDNGTLMAASVAFYLLVSVIPMLMLGVAAVASLIRDPDRAINQTFSFLNQFLPIGRETIRPVIEGVLRERGSLTFIGLAGFALAATGGFATLENAINVMWNRPNRSFVMNKLYAVGMMVVIGFLFAVSVGVSSLVALAGRAEALAWLNTSAWKPILGFVMPPIISTAMFAVIYRFYPNGRTRWGPPLIAGALTAVLWELFKQGYAIYASRDSSPYGIIIGLVMWIYYSCAVVLLGAELTWILEGCPGREGKQAAQAQRDRAPTPRAA